MNDMYERFSAEAQKALGYAIEEAEKWNHEFVGTEHLLLAFTKLKETRVFKFLEYNGATYPNVSKEIERVIGVGTGRTISGELKPTPQIKRIINRAFDEASRYGSRTIISKHLLIALLEEGQSVAVAILQNFRIDSDSVRRYFGPSFNDEKPDISNN